MIRRALFVVVVALVALVRPPLGAVVLAHVTGTNAPIVKAVSGQDPSGGPVFVTGSNFGDGTHAGSISVKCNVVSGGARPGPPMRETMQVVAITTTTLVFTLPPSDAGVYDCLFENVGGGAYPAPSALKVQTTTDCKAHFGAGNVVASLRAGSNALCGGSACTDGGALDSITDLANALTCTATGTARPIWHATSAGTCDGTTCFSSLPVITHDGVDDVITCSIASGITTDLVIYVALRSTDPTGNRIFVSYDTATRTQHVQQSGTALQYVSVGGTVTSPTVIPTKAFQARGRSHNSSGSTFTLGVSESNEPETTASVTDSFGGSSGTLYVGGNSSGAYAAMEWAEVCAVKVATTASDDASEAADLNQRYALGSPTLTAFSPIHGSGGGFRGKVGNVVNGATITVADGLLATTAAGFNSATSIEATIPAGTYSTTCTTPTTCRHNVTVQNPDGSNTTLVGGLTVQDASVYDPMAACGLSVIGFWVFDRTPYYDAIPNLTCANSPCESGDKRVTGATGLAFLDNDLTQPTGADDPILVPADADFGGRDSLAFDGSLTWLAKSNANWGTTTPAYDLYAAARIDPANAQNGEIFRVGSTASSALRAASTNKPQVFNGTTTATWGTSTAGLSRWIEGLIRAGANPQVDVNVSNGTAVTATGTSTAPNAPVTISLGARSTSLTIYYKGKIAAAVGLNANAPSACRTELEAWAHARFGVP